jgi:hypothetical protein
MRKVIFFLLSFTAVCVFTAAATTVAAQSPDKILKQAAKSLGGEKAIKAISSTRIRGRIVQLDSGADGEYRSQVLSPNLYFVSYDLDGFENASGFNGKSGWRRDSRDGSRTLTGDSGRDFQAEAAFHAVRWLNYKADKAKLAPAGQKIIYGKNCNGVYLSTFKGVRIGLYFDAATGLPVREEFPAGDVVRTFDYEDFRKVEGVMEPFRIILSIGEEKWDIKLDEISHNKTIARADFDFPKLSGAPLPEIQTLLKEVQANQDRVEDILENYTYTQTTTHKTADKDGNLKETFSYSDQVTFYKGNRIYRQIENNGKPLTEKEQAKEDKEVADRVADIEKKIARREKKEAEGDAEPEEDQRVSIAEVLRASNLINPRRERFRNRDVIVFDFEPNPNFNYKNAKSILKFFGKTAGVIWIDEKDKQVARMEAYLADSFSVVGGLLKLRKGASFSMEQDRINDEIWLPFSQDINISARVLLVKGMNINQTTRFGNYKKFKTEVKGAKIDEVKDQ